MTCPASLAPAVRPRVSSSTPTKVMTRAARRIASGSDVVRNSWSKVARFVATA